MALTRKQCTQCDTPYAVTVDLGGRLCDVCVGMPELTAADFGAEEFDCSDDEDNDELDEVA